MADVLVFPFLEQLGDLQRKRGLQLVIVSEPRGGPEASKIKRERRSFGNAVVRSKEQLENGPLTSGSLMRRTVSWLGSVKRRYSLRSFDDFTISLPSIRFFVSVPMFSGIVFLMHTLDVSICCP